MKFHPIFAAHTFHLNTEKLRIHTEKLRINTEKLRINTEQLRIKTETLRMANKTTRLTLGKERLERAARLSATNQDAEKALGVQTGAFARACKRHGIETPHQRNRRIGRRYTP